MARHGPGKPLRPGAGEFPGAEQGLGWARYQFKGSKVYAEVDAQGRLLEQDGRVRIRYRVDDDDERTYLAAARNLREIGDEPPPPPKPAPPKPASRPRRKSSRRVAPHFVASEDEELTLLASAPEDEPPIVVYTDGACRGNPGPAGLGVVLISGDHRKEISEYLGHGTNNIAELMAVKRALEEIKATGRRILMHIDSEYVRGVLSLGWKAKANRELIEDLREFCATFPDLHFVKVPAHSGVEENECADRLANQAIEKHVGKSKR